MSDQTNINDDWDRSVYAQDYVVTVCSYLVLLAMVIIVVIFTRRLSLHRKQNAQNDDTEQESINPQRAKDIKAITTASIAGIYIYLLSSISLAIVLTKWIIIDQEHGNRMHRILAVVPTCFWAINMFVFLPIILLRRLHIVRPSKWKYFIAASYGVPVFALLLTFSIIGVNNYFATVFTRMIMVSYASIVVLTYVIIAIIYFHTISKVMKNRLIANVRIMTLEMTEFVDTAGKVTPIPQTHDETHDVIVDIQTVKDTVRYAVLVMVCVCTTFLFTICVALAYIIARDPTHRNTISELGQMIDTLSNTVSICLMFRFMDDCYFSVCRLCHRCVFGCFTNKVANNYRKDNPNLKYDYDQYKTLIVKE